MHQIKDIDRDEGEHGPSEPDSFRPHPVSQLMTPLLYEGNTRVIVGVPALQPPSHPSASWRFSYTIPSFDHRVYRG